MRKSDGGDLPVLVPPDAQGNQVISLDVRFDVRIDVIEPPPRVGRLNRAARDVPGTDLPGLAGILRNKNSRTAFMSSSCPASSPAARLGAALAAGAGEPFSAGGFSAAAWEFARIIRPKAALSVVCRIGRYFLSLTEIENGVIDRGGSSHMPRLSRRSPNCRGFDLRVGEGVLIHRQLVNHAAARAVSLGACKSRAGADRGDGSSMCTA